MTIIANDLPFQSDSPDPFDALGSTLAFSSQDWSTAADFAWLYGIVVGWADEEDDALPDLARRFGWTEQQVEHLRLLNVEFENAHALYRGDV